MKYANRGHNISCTNMISGRCYITSQNHRYAVGAITLSKVYMGSFVNANDESNKGIIHIMLSIFSVQFHPESTSGSRDAKHLFD